MSDLNRFGISLPEKLLHDFDRYIHNTGYSNRSEAIRDLIREKLVQKEWTEKKKEIAGAIVFIYDHHVRELLNKVNHVQHDFYKLIISTQHIHLDHDNCFEIIAVKGSSSRVRDLFTQIRSIKGIKHAVLSMSSTGRELS